MAKYDHEAIARYREGLGWSWDRLAQRFGAPSGETLRRVHARWAKRNQPEPAGDTSDGSETTEGEESVVAVLTEEQVSRITSLEDLLEFFKVDTEVWEVRDYRVNKWEQHSVQKGVTPLYQVRANLIRRKDKQVQALEAELARVYEDALAHEPPAYAAVERRQQLADDPCLFELAVHDPHIGMLAWGEEVGESYDSKIAASDYAKAVEHLLGFATLYPTERILYVVGHDLLHVDAAAVGPKGSNRGGATTAGTMQDVDTRLAKMFTAARRAVIAGIDRARLIAPVDVVVVPGNHDTQQMYRLAEVLSAWYRNDPEVDVQFGPDKRRWYRYGRNGFLLTHGEEYKRQRDNLAMIFATEAPREILAECDHWEVHTGHNHIAMAGRYVPTSELTETRSIRVRSLPGITPEDAWHHESGYKHRRAATVLAHRKSGGIVGHHEFTL